MMTLPVYQQNEAFQTRSTKLKEIQALGVEAYPHDFKPTHHAKQLHGKYEDEEVGQGVGLRGVTLRVGTGVVGGIARAEQLLQRQRLLVVRVRGEQASRG